MPAIEFTLLVGRRRLPASKAHIVKTLTTIAHLHKRKNISLSIVITNDEHLRRLSKQLLHKDHYTDVITIPLENTPQLLSGEIFISIERVMENARQEACLPAEELVRVAAHGVLHLLGYEDHTPTERERMRQAEQQAIAIYRRIRTGTTRNKLT